MCLFLRTCSAHLRTNSLKSRTWENKSVKVFNIYTMKENLDFSCIKFIVKIWAWYFLEICQVNLQVEIFQIN